MTAFASGALLADVLLHNLPEIFKEEGNGEEIDPHSIPFFQKKEIYICIGVIALFAIEKIIVLLTGKSDSNIKPKNQDLNNTKKKSKTHRCDKDKYEESSENDHAHENDSHGHSHAHTEGGNLQNIIISFLGDFVHNVTDGLALGAAFGTSKNTKNYFFILKRSKIRNYINYFNIFP